MAEVFEKNNPLYGDIEINDEEIDKLPAHGDIDSVLQTEFMHDDTTINEDINKTSTEVQNGPESGAATGNHKKDPLTESFVTLPPESMSGLVEDEILKTMKEKIDEAKDAPVFGWPSIGEKVSDYSYEHVQALAFPTLFPNGVGDYFGGERELPITLGQSAAHLLKYAVKSYDGEWIYPFARNMRWLHWIQNTVERHRFNSQKLVFLQKHPEFANLSDAELEKMIDKNEDELKDLLSKMQMYSSNLLGSNAYFYKRRTELQGLMAQEGMWRMWYFFIFEEVRLKKLIFFSPIKLIFFSPKYFSLLQACVLCGLLFLQLITTGSIFSSHYMVQSLILMILKIS